MPRSMPDRRLLLRFPQHRTDHWHRLESEHLQSDRLEPNRGRRRNARDDREELTEPKENPQKEKRRPMERR